MEQLGSLFLRVAALSAGCSVVVAPLLVLAPRIRKRVAARSFYVLFLLLALRMALPVELPSVRPVMTVPVPEYTVSVPVRTPVMQPAVAAAVPGQPEVPVRPVQTAPAARQVSMTTVLGAVWAAGIAVYVLWTAGGYILARRNLLRSSAPADGAEIVLLEQLRGALNVKRPVRLCQSEHTAGPLALGLLRPVVVLPRRAYGREELELILRHELTHIRRWDVAYKMVLSLACAVNWFNPLVWLMSRAAGRNLELCCDDDVSLGLSDGERRQYGKVLLDAAGAARPIPFSTCFAGGKKQMKDRLLNLFLKKKNSVALVCLVLAAALLAGGLVACERASGAENLSGTENGETLSPENEERRAILKDYFYQNYTEDSASVVLADLTGDGLDEMMVLSIDLMSSEKADLRQPVGAEQFAYGGLTICGVKGGAVFQYDSITDVSNSHAGWGYVYLVPRPDGDGFALLDFRPYTGQGMASYTYGVYVLDEEWLYLDGGEAYFSLDPVESMDPDGGDDATPEVAQALLDRVQAYRDSGVVLLVYNEAYDSSTGETEFAYLNAAPADAFAGKLDTISALRGCVISNGGNVEFPLPPAGPATLEEALDRLEASLEVYPDGWVFRIPNYKGDWNVQIAGRMRMGDEESDDFMSVHYLEEEEWKPGKRYGFETEGVWFSELTLTAAVTSSDGRSAERTIVLVENGDVGWGYPADIPTLPEDAAMEGLIQSIEGRDNGFAFTLPHYNGTWEVQISGRMRLGDEGSEEFMSVHYLEDEAWESDRSYFVETGDAWFDELYLWARATGPDGSEAENSILLAGASAAPGDWGERS